MTINWDSRLDTGIEVIDAQHKRLIVYVNQLEVAKRRQDAALVGDVLGQLIEYTQSHFGFEEAMLEDAKVMFLDLHKHEHERFIEDITAYSVRAAKGEYVGDELYSMISNWLIHHIGTEDRAYVPAVLAAQAADEPAEAPAQAPAKRGLFGRFRR